MLVGGINLSDGRNGDQKSTERVIGKRLRAAIICDFTEENWPSMNLIPDMLLEKFASEHPEAVEAVRIRPRFRWRLARAREHSAGVRFNADRVLNRFVDYPLELRRWLDRFDVFHVTDHSYSHLVRYLPPTRTIVSCHDIDSFRCVLEPSQEPRPLPFKLMTRHIIGGFRKAAAVGCGSEATREQLLRHRLVTGERTVTIPYGVSPLFTPEPERNGDRDAERLIGHKRSGVIEILHVGSTIPRKRIDVLLHVFAGIREEFRESRLIRVSGPFTEGQNALLRELRLEPAVTVLPFVPTATLAALYRRAALVILPSEAEGFGLPVAEAMACGTIVIASDLAALREAGGNAALFAPVGDVSALVKLALDALRERHGSLSEGRRRRSLENAARFSWTEFANRYLALYQTIDRRV
jgi:glycosyltransferase involved in cell wall biosynthesis